MPLASNSMFSKFFSRDNGNREDVPDVAIIFVGGDAQHRVVSQMRVGFLIFLSLRER